MALSSNSGVRATIPPGHSTKSVLTDLLCCWRCSLHAVSTEKLRIFRHQQTVLSHGSPILLPSSFYFTTLRLSPVIFRTTCRLPNLLVNRMILNLRIRKCERWLSTQPSLHVPSRSAILFDRGNGNFPDEDGEQYFGEIGTAERADDGMIENVVLVDLSDT